MRADEPRAAAIQIGTPFGRSWPQDSEQEQGGYAPQYTPSQQAQEPQQPQQGTTPAGLPVSDLPGLAGEPRTGDGS